MIAARTSGGPAYQEMIEEMDRELNSVIEDFDRAVNVEALRLANETSKLSFLNLPIFDPQWFGVERTDRELVELVERNERERMDRERHEREQLEQERSERERLEQERTEQDRVEREQELLFRRLMPVKTGYHRKFRCMNGTRQSLLNQITDWVANTSGQENLLQRKIERASCRERVCLAV